VVVLGVVLEVETQITLLELQIKVLVADFQNTMEMASMEVAEAEVQEQ
jgi:hypothetical protein